MMLSTRPDLMAFEGATDSRGGKAQGKESHADLNEVAPSHLPNHELTIAKFSDPELEGLVWVSNTVMFPSPCICQEGLLE